MRKCRVLILLTIAAVLSGFLFSCGATIQPVTVKLIITASDDEILNTNVTLNYKDPTVLMLVKEAAMLYELKVDYNADEDSVLNINDYKEKSVDNIDYFWEYYINGVLPENATGGKANAQPIKDGDEIHYVYSTYDTKAVTK